MHKGIYWVYVHVDARSQCHLKETDSNKLGAQMFLLDCLQVPRIPGSLPLRTGVTTAPSFYMGGGCHNSNLYAWKESTLLTEPSPLPEFTKFQSFNEAALPKLGGNRPTLVALTQSGCFVST